MKGIMVRGIAALAFALLLAQATAQETKPVLETDKDKFSYTIGVQLGQMLKQQGVEPQLEALLQGMRDELTSQTLLLNEQEREDAIAKGKQAMMDERTKAGEANKKKGEEFLAANKTKEGVVTLPSGLQYKILKEGTGKKATETDIVVVNYRGTLINGEEFDKGENADFPVGRVVPGFSEALKLMPMGSKWQLFIPSDLAYGENGAGGKIGPNEVLIFELEVVEIKEAPAGEPGLGLGQPGLGQPGQ